MPSIVYIIPPSLGIQNELIGASAVNSNETGLLAGITSALTEAGITLPTLVQPASYDEAIAWAANQLPTDQPGVVLLSPGAKSFDQFQDYRDRGQKFAEAASRFINQSH